MTELKTLARPYAVAAYEFAKQRNQVNAWANMLANIRALVLTESMHNVLNAPTLDATTFLSLLEPFAKQALDAHGFNFLKLLIVHHRLALAPMIYDLFEALQAQAENIVNVDITTAISLNDDQQRVLAEKIVQHLQQKIAPTFYVDAAIIAGAVVRVGDEYVLDGSIKTQLERLKTQF